MKKYKFSLLIMSSLLTITAAAMKVVNGNSISRYLLIVGVAGFFISLFLLLKKQPKENKSE